MPDRYFTVDEAEALLPVLDSLLEKAMAGKKTLEGVHSEIAALNEHITMRGGVLLDLEQNAKIKVRKELAMRDVRDAVGEIQAAGCVVKDLDIGLIDFPCRMDGREIYLCWKHGEAAIGFWHATDEGFANRKPIKSEWLRGRASN